ncbi:MAG: hypothetical protein M5U19_09055 [Microthrixaceae bacterium]|nr:hypothetical protein [Microthrixaceae bacterium]
MLLAAVISFDQDRIVRCAVLVAVAASIKLTAVFVVVPLVVITFARRRKTDALKLAAIPGVVLAATGLLIEGSLDNASAGTRPDHHAGIDVETAPTDRRGGTHHCDAVGDRGDFTRWFCGSLGCTVVTPEHRVQPAAPCRCSA